MDEEHNTLIFYWILNILHRVFTRETERENTKAGKAPKLFVQTCSPCKLSCYICNLMLLFFRQNLCWEGLKRHKWEIIGDGNKKGNWDNRVNSEWLGELVGIFKKQGPAGRYLPIMVLIEKTPYKLMMIILI